jgi:HemY protein
VLTGAVKAGATGRRRIGAAVMLRVLFFVILVAILGLGFAWVADTPGTIVMTVAGREITVTLMVAAVALAAAVVAVMTTWWIIRVVITSPQRMQRFFRARRRDRGYQSLSTGIIAAGAGDSVTARKMLKQANGLLNATTEPLIQLLDAQASIVEGHNDEAREKFEAMLEDPELRILGPARPLHGGQAARRPRRGQTLCREGRRTRAAARAGRARRRSN